MTVPLVLQEARRLGLPPEQVVSEATAGKVKELEYLESWISDRLNGETAGWAKNIRAFLVNMAIRVRDRKPWEWAVKAARQYYYQVGKAVEKPFGFIRACLENPWYEFPKDKDKDKDNQAEVSVSPHPLPLPSDMQHPVLVDDYGEKVFYRCGDCYTTRASAEAAQNCTCHLEASDYEWRGKKDGARGPRYPGKKKRRGYY